MDDDGSISLRALGLAIRQRRDSIGVRADDVALRCNTHRSYVYGLERGERNISWRTLNRIADVLDIGMSDLVAAAERIEARGDAAPPPP